MRQKNKGNFTFLLSIFSFKMSLYKNVDHTIIFFFYYRTAIEKLVLKKLEKKNTLNKLIDFEEVASIHTIYSRN